MGRRGPRPKSRDLAKLHGNVGHKAREAFADQEIVEGIGDLWEPPRWFDAEQRRKWRDAVDQAPAGLLTGTDRALLTVFTVACVEYATAARQVSAEGAMILTKAGNQIQNPHLSIMNRQSAIMLKAAKDLGFTPHARAALGEAMPASGSGRRRRKDGLAAYLREKPDDLEH